MSGLPSIKVDVIEAGKRPKQNWKECIIDENIRFSSKSLETFFFSSWEPVVYDAMLLAAAVEFCDRVKQRPAMGWGRDIELRLPVHNPDLWNAPHLLQALTDTLSFLTGDAWHIQFVPRQQPVRSVEQIPIHFPSQVTSVLPYSDGMDSHSVAGMLSQELGNKLVRIRVGSSKTGKDHIFKGKPEPFAAVPYKVYRGRHKFVESSARSRGFKFPLISGLAAFLAQASEVIVPESGQGILGPPLLTTGQGYEDYRNHPFHLKRMENFLECLLNYKVHYRFPRIWYTKGETLRAFVEKSQATTWMNTRSCWQQSRQIAVEKKQRHCGICAACMLRRLSVHAAGLSEPTEVYTWEDLGATSFEAGVAYGFEKDKITQSLEEYAIAGTLHLDHMAGLRQSTTHSPMLKRHALKLSQILGLPLEETEGKLNRLLQQHENEWKSFLHSLGPNSFIQQWVQTTL